MTKQIDTFQAQEKEYEGELTIGAVTPSYDLETTPQDFKEYNHLKKEDLEKFLPNFLGEIDQKPPIFSAVKVQGKALYKIARKGGEVEIPTKKVTIKHFEITEFEAPKAKFKVICSKGTYIRSLVNDLGQSLGTGAYLSALRRTKIGDFDVKNAETIDTFLENLKNIY
jgi:tRNA pseudouridine55 synthase